MTAPRSHDEDDRPDEPTTGPLDGLGSLVEAIARLATASRSDGGPVVDGQLSWGTIGNTRVERSSRSDTGQRLNSPAHEDRDGRCRIDTRLEDESFVVTADIEQIAPSDRSIGIDPRTNEFVIAESGAALARVPLPWTRTEPVHSRLQNGVLTIRFEPDG